MSKSAWIHIIFGNACSTQGLWLDKIGGSENFLIFIPYLDPLVHSGHWWIEVTNSAPRCCQGGLICQHTPAAILPLTFCSATITLGLNLVIWHSILVKNRHFQHHCLLNFPRQSRGCGGWRWGAVAVDCVQLRTCYSSSGPLNCANCEPPNEERRRGN